MPCRMWVSVFPSRDDMLRAHEALEKAGLLHQWRAEGVPEGLYPCALSVEEGHKAEAHAAIVEANVLLSGFYETDKPLPSAAPPELRETPGIPDGKGYLRGVAIVFVTDCVADPTKIRLIARLFTDVAECMPYLNAELKTATYVHEGAYLTFAKEHRMITLYPEQAAIAKADDIDDGWRTLLWLCALIDDVYARRDQIEPNYETRQRPHPLQIFSWLPRTNCRQCGELTCLAFAAMLIQGNRKLADCKPLFTDTHKALRERMLELAEVLGV